MSNLTTTLVERGRQYGDFYAKAVFIQNAKALMHNTPVWDYMEDDQREALEMIQHKISRILYGDPTVVDTWHDIAGYAKLVEDRLNGVDSNAPARVGEARANEPVTAGKAGAVHTRGLPEYETYMYGDLGVIRSFGGND